MNGADVKALGFALCMQVSTLTVIPLISCVVEKHFCMLQVRPNDPQEETRFEGLTHLVRCTKDVCAVQVSV